MTRHHPIVVGVSGTPSSLQAVSWAAQEAVLRSAPLTLLTSLFVPGTFGVPLEVPADMVDRDRLDAERRLDEAREVATGTASRPLEITATTCTGPPAGELIDRSASAQMVVVGSNRRGSVTRTFAGSVASPVVAHAHAPVAVVPALPDSEVSDVVGPVVVGVDGTAHSARAITVAFEEAALRGVDLVAVHAWSDVDIYARFPADFDWAPIELRERTVLAESLAGRSADFPEVEVHPIVVMDRPAENLRTRAEHAQLLVVGSRGRGGFASMLLGSTSLALTNSTACPLLVVR